LKKKLLTSSSSGKSTPLSNALCGKNETRKPGMPIANCHISIDFETKPDNTSRLIELWADNSIQSSDEMTVNLISVNQQHGKQYQILAQLLLPSIWSKPDVSLLQTGLAKALSIYFQIPINEVFVATSIVESGFVVDSGKEVRW
jgi:hypothetical protein